jgi:hypothetical protein
VKVKLLKLNAENLNNQAEFLKLAASLQQIEAEKAKLERHKELIPFQNEYRALRLMEKNELELKARLELLATKEIQLKDEEALLLVSVNNLLKNNVLKENIETELALFKQQVLDLLHKEKEINTLINGQNSQLLEALQRLKNEQFVIEKPNQNVKPRLRDRNFLR